MECLASEGARWWRAAGFLVRPFFPLNWDPVHYMKMQAVVLTLNGLIGLSTSVLTSVCISYLHCSN